MKPEQQRIAIAEAHGYKPECKCRLKQPRWRTPDDSGCCSINELPNYLNDLNALHEAEKTLIPIDYMKYVETLAEICGGGEDYYEGWTFWSMEKITIATAVQRAEAFLKTIGKWIED